MGFPRFQRGFTLLEAIVALTVFSMVAMALFSWLGSNMGALARVESRQLALSDARTALALLETINPLEEPEGARELSGLEVRWSAEPVVERTSGIGASGAPTVFDMALFDVEVEYARDEGPTEVFVVRRAGWVTARSFLPEDMLQ